jgi:hypothetical protein
MQEQNLRIVFGVITAAVQIAVCGVPIQADVLYDFFLLFKFCTL